MLDLVRSSSATPRRRAVRTNAGYALAVSLIAAAFMAGGNHSARAQSPAATPLFPQSTGVANPTTFQNSADGLLPSTEVDRSQPLYLQGDQLIYDNSGDTVIARGNVEIYYNNNALTADEVVYDQSANTLTAQGNVTLREPNGNVIRADRYTLTDDFRDGFVESLSIVAKDETRIAARRATRTDGNVTEFSDAKFTPCRTVGDQPPLWCISSRRIIHDTEQQTITYQDAQFELFGQPVAYLPYFQHPDPSVKRRSGFLPPSYTTSSDLGFMATTPYYFALDPSYDFTFAPGFSTKQGVLFQGEWRQRLANGSYNVELAGIDQYGSALPDTVSPERRSELEGFRGSLKTQGVFSLSSWWRFGWDITLESDDTFRRFYRLDSVLLTDRVNNTYLEGMSDRNYFGAQLYHFGGLLVEDTPRSESRVHPVIDYNYVFDQPVLGGELRWDSNVSSLSRDESIRLSSEPRNFEQNTARVTTELSWRRKMIDRIGITYTPFAYVRGDVTQYENYRDPFAADPFAELANPTLEDEVRASGVAGGGITISYPWVASGGGATHTIEPIGQIIGRTATNEKRSAPNEDAQSLVFDDTTLFEVDKFSGFDRFETGTRANVGMQYTFQLNSGGYGRVLAGQSYQISGTNPFADPGRRTDVEPGDAPAITRENIDTFQRFTHSPYSGLETSHSDYVLGVYFMPSPNLKIISQSRFDEENFALRRQDAIVSTTVGPISASAAYSLAKFDPEFGFEDDQQELRGGVGLQLTERWSLNGSINYDVDEDFLLSNTLRLHYADECFILTASYSEQFYNDESRDIDTNRTIYLAFEFKHLGLVGYRTDILQDSNDESLVTP